MDEQRKALERSTQKRRADEQAYRLWLAALLIFVAVILAASVSPTAMIVMAVLGVVVSMGGFYWNRRTRQELLAILQASEKETQRASASERRLRALHELTTTMSATLDHDQILGTALLIGNIGLKEPDIDTRLIAAAFLFRTSDKQLHIASAQRLTPIDIKKSTSGEEGVIHQALETAKPAFGGPAVDDPELSYYVGFQKALSTVAMPLQATYLNYGVIVFGIEQEEAFDRNSSDLLATVGTQTTVALQNAVLYQKILAEKERIVEAEENARKKLSRDLHDGPTQTISAIAMRINAIRNLIRSNEPRRAYDDLGKIFDMATRTTKQIRYMLFAMRPLVMESQGFVAALEEMSKKFADTYQLKVIIQADADAEHWLEDDAQGALFYVIEEAVNNARKHAEAEHVIVRIYRSQDACIIEIEDNGVGFDVKSVDDSYHQRGSLGMVSMRERAELADGELRVQSRPGRGTRISIRVPLPIELTDTAKRRLISKERDPNQMRGDVPLSDTRFSPRTVDTTAED